jgi:hypothetical protein
VKKAGGQISIQDTKDHFVKDWCPSNGEWNGPCLWKDEDIIIVLKLFWE